VTSAYALEIALPIVLGFALSLGACAVLVRLLPRWQFKQVAYEDAPQSHQGKTGTPTMGGICFAVAALPLLFLTVRGSLSAGALLFLTLGCGAIGFIDDYLAVRSGTNRGLPARTKYLATALVAAIFLRSLESSFANEPVGAVFMASWHSLYLPTTLWLVLGVLAITGTVHAVNLTDGLDGLAAGTMIAPLCVVAVLSFWLFPAPFFGSLLMVGACIGFLIYNRHPARMFMGDTGSLALGALLAGSAIMTGEMLLLIVIGGVFVAETLSVILQVTYFKATKGKRIFKMSPLHHHFELSDWPETKVTSRFIVASVLCSLIGLAIFA
jgi:phospho-N-acetylmuramoyl-pentapeptide-transferase